MANRKVKKKSLTSFSQSPRQPPPNDKVELEPSSSSSGQPPLPFSLPPPLALDSQPTVKTNPSSILGKAPVAHVGVHVGVGLSARKHKSGSATKTVEDIPPERLASDEDMEEELHRVALTLTRMIPLIWARMMTQSASRLQPTVPKDGGIDKEVPAEPLPPTAVKRSKNSKWGRSIAREERAAETAVRASGVALDSELLTSCVGVASVFRDELEFDSFPSDPMCAEVAAAIGEWEIIKNKNRCSRNVKQAATMSDGSATVGLAFPHVSEVVSRQKNLLLHLRCWRCKRFGAGCDIELHLRVRDARWEIPVVLPLRGCTSQELNLLCRLDGFVVEERVPVACCGLWFLFVVEEVFVKFVSIASDRKPTLLSLEGLFEKDDASSEASFVLASASK
ncbi:hypothetical protein SADUNF_Sadunf16G0049400 [Salix dunnii]|uniref:Uncharacterized protein n=1 Tax=Salix dunnii TaxID=1413687 RepID=A0A835JAG0_9ROSI|nr:hypothetical protein SADUNF_Sadunf16G0049400 [Salix dunnii]